MPLQIDDLAKLSHRRFEKLRCVQHLGADLARAFGGSNEAGVNVISTLCWYDAWHFSAMFTGGAEVGDYAALTCSTYGSELARFSHSSNIRLFTAMVVQEAIVKGERLGLYRAVAASRRHGRKQPEAETRAVTKRLLTQSSGSNRLFELVKFQCLPLVHEALEDASYLLGGGERPAASTMIRIPEWRDKVPEATVPCAPCASHP